MSHTIRHAAFSIAMALAACAASPAWGQTGEMTPKTLAENDKVLVTETIGKPGESTPSVMRLGQVYYYVKGGKVELTYSDGTKATVTRKTGQALIIKEKRAYSAKNIGTTPIHVITVTLK